jgi:hypothetical protein
VQASLPNVRRENMRTLVPEVGFAGTTTTHLLKKEWSYTILEENRTACGLQATAVGYYQLGMAEVTCLSCLSIMGKEK